MKKDHERIPGAGLRDGGGHLSARVVADLMARSRDQGEVSENGWAFLREARSSDRMAEQLGESFVDAATGGEEASDDAPDEVEASGGLFVEAESETDSALDTDVPSAGGATGEEARDREDLHPGRSRGDVKATGAAQSK